VLYLARRPASHNFQLLNTLPSYRLLGIGVISRSKLQATGEQKAQACDMAWLQQLTSAIPLFHYQEATVFLPCIVWNSTKPGRDADLIVLHGANVLAGLFFNYLEM
jgi:hypothetical protein